MKDNEVNLKDSTIGGKFTGRDDYSVNFTSSYERSTYLSNLYAKFEEEKKSDAELLKLCEELEYFSSQVEGDEIEGLENKLSAASKAPHIIRYATECKEKFHKKLMFTAQYSSVAQDINVYILSKIRRSFLMEIYSLICSGAPEFTIQTVITERIITPVKAELGINLFNYNEDDIMGMIFFLTGNCHIKWTK